MPSATQRDATVVSPDATVVSSEGQRRASLLRQQLLEPNLAFLMEAHDALSARVVEAVGFEGIWASGLSMSSALGVRDCNEATWTQILDVLEFMADATTKPILVDGDTGHGNFNTVRRFVKKLCQRNIAGVCIEDKVFPKMNSFIGDGQVLADIDEFCGRIRAAKDSQLYDDFTVIARVEALIAGKGLDEALRRAHAYCDAGADGVLIHSKMDVADEIVGFVGRWQNRAPVVIVPTRYYRTPTSLFQEIGISLVIWANHNLRAAVAAMMHASRVIRRTQRLIDLEPEIAPLGEIFRLCDYEELDHAEARYVSRAPVVGRGELTLG